MSGVIMMRMEHGILLLTDGMLSESSSSPTLSGKTSKVIHYRHMPAVVAMTGDFMLLGLTLLFHQGLWHDFDTMVDEFREAIGQRIAAELPYYAEPELGARYFLGGYSHRRKRWETYRLEVYACGDDPWAGIGELEPAPQVVIAPVADAASLRRYGFDPDNVSIGSDARKDLVRLMRALRATPVDFGLRGVGEWTPGHMVGFFIEETILALDVTISRLVWEFPEDEVGKPIDASHEGNAIEWEKVEDAPAEEA